MKAFILAAGLGTRLRPWTLEHPKALAPVAGVPMLERVITRLRNEGFDDITVNVHHFADQIVEALAESSYGNNVKISDETERLLDTGGALAQAAPLLRSEGTPVLVHNVDILSDAPLKDIFRTHVASGRDISLVTSPRDSSRQLIFDRDNTLVGWYNKTTGAYRPEGFIPTGELHFSAFSGIYIINESVLDDLQRYARECGESKFPIMDYLLGNPYKNNIGEIRLSHLNLIDIGKPETLEKAQYLVTGNQK